MPPKRTARGKRVSGKQVSAPVPPTKQDLLQVIEGKYGFDAAAMLDQLSDDRASMAEMEEFVREIATEVGVKPEGLRARLNTLFERKAVSPRRGAHHCRNARSYYDLDTMMYLVPDEDLVVDSSNICYKKDELISQFRSDSESNRRFANPEGILFSELEAKHFPGIAAGRNMRESVENAVGVSDGGYSAFVRAAEQGQAEAVRELAERMSPGAIAFRNGRGETALMFAARFGHVEAVHVLMGRMSDEAILLRDDYGFTALMYAAMYDRVEAVRALMERMSDESIAHQTRYGTTALTLAAQNGRVEVVRVLLERMSDEAIALKDRYGTTALMLAARFGHVEVVRVLMERMSDEAIALKDGYGKTALMFASKYGHVEVVRALMERMSDEAIALQDRDGNTALTFAEIRMWAEVARVLLERMSYQ